MSKSGSRRGPDFFMAASCKYDGGRSGMHDARPKRNSKATRERILAAATYLFSEHGYAATGMRDIAVMADASLPMLSRYFGSKVGLFEAALRNALFSQALFDVERENFGVHLAKLIITAKQAELPMAIAVLAAADPEARRIATRVVQEQIVAPLARWIGGPAAQPRAIAIVTLGAGFVTHLHLLPLLASQELTLDDPNVRWFARSCQQIVDAKEDWSPPGGLMDLPSSIGPS